MKKMIVFIIPFIAAGCAVRPMGPQPAITPDTVKQVEAKAADMSQAVMLNVKDLNGYFLKNSVKLNSEVSYFAVNTQKNFDAVLGIGKTMANTVTFADMRKNIVAVIAMKPSRTINDIKVVKAYAVGSDVFVEYEILPQTAPDVGYFVSNVQAFEIQKPAQVTNVSFSEAGKGMTVIPFGRRSAGSPRDMQVLLKYYTGTYKGTVPAPDGQSIEITLTLFDNYTYNLKQVYVNVPGRVFESFGKWTPSEDLALAELNYDKPLTERSYFYFIDRNSVEKLDSNGEKIAVNPELYILKK